MPDQHDDLAKARSYLGSAEDWLHEAIELNRINGTAPFTALATANAAIGTGYAQLAAAEVITAQPEPIVLHQMPGDPTVVADLRRRVQALDEARPHDGEPTGAGSCEFVLDGKRCVFGDGHGAGYHHLEDGTDIEAGRG